MTAALRTVAFGDLDAGVCGAAWGRAAPFLTLGAAGGGSAPGWARLEGDDQSQDWRLSGDRVELLIAADGEAAPLSDGFDQLCRVHGRCELDGAQQSLDCRGRRASRTGVEIDHFESIRDVSAWFEPGEGLVLTALRPRGASGHASDVITAAVFEAGRSYRVADPRLSTTYTSEGAPARVSLELWLGDEQEEYPRRAAGEAAADPVRPVETDDELTIQAALLRWHSRGLEGAGVYLIGRRR